MRKHKGWWLGMLGGMLLVVLGLLLSPGSHATTQSLATPTPMPSEQVYTRFENTEWGYSVEYPESWEVETVFTNTSTAPFYIIRERTSFTSISDNNVQVTVDVWERKPNTSIEVWFETVEGITEIFQSNAIIGGQKAYLFGELEGCGSSTILVTYIPFDEKVFRIHYLNIANDKDWEIYYEILRSFSLLGPGASLKSQSVLPELHPRSPTACECPNKDCGNCYYAAKEDGCCGYPQIQGQIWQCSRDCVSNEFKGNCTWWAAYTRRDAGHWANVGRPPGGSGAAEFWGINVRNTGELPVDHTPKVGDIVVNPAEIYGHVAYVVWVSDDRTSYKISDMRWCKDCGDTPDEALDRGLGADDEFIHCKNNPEIPTHDWRFTNCPFGWTPSKGFEDTFLSNDDWVLNPRNDPYLLSPIISVSASEYNAVEVTMVNTANDTSGRIYFTTDSSSAWGEDKAVGFNAINDHQWHEITVNMSGNQHWYGTIKRIRVDPIGSGESGVEDNVSIRRIRFVNTTSNIPPNPPILQSPADGSPHNSRTVTLEWQDGGDPDNQPRNYRDYVLSVWKPGWSWATDWIEDTSWAVTVPGEGVYSWHVMAGDGAVGGDWSETWTFRVDMSDPSIAFDIPTEDRWYNTDKTLSWTVSDGGAGVDYFKWAWNDSTPDTRVNGASGSTTLAAAGERKDNVLYVQAWDKAGNHTNVVSKGWFGYDKTAPSKASNVRPDGWTGPYTGDTTPRFKWDAASDSGSGLAGYYVAVDDWTPEGSYSNDWTVGPITSYEVPNALPEGKHHFAVTSRDNAGNANPENTNKQGDAPYTIFYVDTQPPTKPSVKVSGTGCSDALNNVWQNTCNAPSFTWQSSDSVSDVKDYVYYWGDSSRGSPVTSTTDTTFSPSAIAPADGVGTRYLNVIARDDLDHASGQTSFGVRYDGAPPTVTLRINDDAVTTHQVNVWLDLAATDEGSGVSQMRFSNNGLDWSAWEAYNNAKLWTLPSLNRREHSVYVQVRDRAGNESGAARDSITLDLYPVMPHSASYRICDDVVDAGGTVGLTSTSFSLVSAIGQPWATGANANSSPAHTARSGFLASVTGCRPITHAVTSNYTVTQWVIASGGNLRGSTSFRLGDTAGQPAASHTNAFTSTSFTLSSGFWAQITGTVPPTTTVKPTPVVTTTPTPTPTPSPTPTPQPEGFGVSINDGALYTNDPNVTVNTWAPNVTQVRLSNDGGYVDEGWTTYRLTHTWVISTYGATVMPRTVYAWFKDDAGAVYGPYEDDIVYDPVAPRGSVRVMGTSQTGLRQATSVVTLSLEASDDNSGVAQMRLGEGPLRMAAWQPYTDTITWTLSSAIVFVQFQDRADNISALYGSDASEHALASPPISVTLSGPTTGYTGTAHTFTAEVLPVTATVPLTYVWEATGHAPITHATMLQVSDTLSYTWTTVGTQAITVTVSNGLGEITGTTGITLVGKTPACAQPLEGVGIRQYQDGSMSLYIDTLYAFHAVITPTDATPPITYTWAPVPDLGQGTASASYRWSTAGMHTVTLAAQNCGGTPYKATHIVTIHVRKQYIYLPLVLRNSS